MANARSEELQFLEGRLTQIRQSILAGIDPDGLDFDDVSDQVLAYRLLVQSEIFTYLRERSRRLAQLALVAWKQESKATKVAMCLFAYSGNAWDRPTTSVNLDTTTNLLETAVHSHLANIRKISGLRERDVLQLLVPVGIDYEDIGDWLSTIESYVVKTADATRNLNLVRQGINPEVRMVEKVALAGLVKLDEKFNLLQSELTPSRPAGLD